MKRKCIQLIIAIFIISQNAYINASSNNNTNNNNYNIIAPGGPTQTTVATVAPQLAADVFDRRKLVEKKHSAEDTTVVIPRDKYPIDCTIDHYVVNVALSKSFFRKLPKEKQDKNWKPIYQILTQAKKLVRSNQTFKREFTQSIPNRKVRDGFLRHYYSQSIHPELNDKSFLERREKFLQKIMQKHKLDPSKLFNDPLLIGMNKDFKEFDELCRTCEKDMDKQVVEEIKFTLKGFHVVARIQFLFFMNPEIQYKEDFGISNWLAAMFWTHFGT